MQIPANLLAALKADLANAAASWQCVSADESKHETTEADPVDPQQTVTVVHRHVTVTLESLVRGLTLVFMLEGLDGAPPTGGKLYHRGNSFSIDDEALLATLDSKVGLVNQLYADDLLAKLGEAI